jgi:hypothetical protein
MRQEMTGDSYAVSQDTLSFPLNAAMERLRRKSKFNVFPILLKSSFVGLIVLTIAYRKHMPYTFETTIMPAMIFFLITAFLYSWVMLGSMRQAKKTIAAIPRNTNLVT